MKISRGTYAKVARARKHLQHLEGEISGFCGREGYAVTYELDHDIGEKSLILTASEAIPDDWSAGIGDIAHNLRSALDHAVYDASVQEVGSPVALSEFPIFFDKDLFLRDGRGGGLHKIRGVSAKTRTVIEQIQPFNTRKEGAESILWILQEVSNMDKHRTLHLCRRATEDFRIEIVKDIPLVGGFEWLAPLGILEDRTVVARWKPSALDGDMDMKAHISFNVVFQDGLLANNPVIGVCEKLIIGVEKVIHYLEASLE